MKTMKMPTREELEAFAPELLAKNYGGMMERMQTLVKAVIEEYPRTERMLACNGVIGIALGMLSAGIGLTDEESKALDAEFMAMIFKWFAIGIGRNPAPFEGGLPEAMKRPEGS